MKELTKFFQQRRYSSVDVSDDQDVAATTGHTNAVAVALQRHCAAVEEKQRRKSLKTNCSMNPARILSFFFNERQNSKGARSPKCAFVLLAAGILALTAAILVKILHPYDFIFKWKLMLAEGGEIFNLWAEPPVDLYLKVYLFNVTNAEAFLAGREKLNVEQVGPYTYKELMAHKNITFNGNNTISTKPSHPLVWQEHLSEGNREDDEVVMLNIAMLAISQLAAEKSYFFRVALNTLFVTSKSLPIVRMTAKEFMFGYQSSLTTLGNTFLPSWISFEKVGLIDRMYDFDSDFETFYTGVPNPYISGLYNTYRGSPNLPHWNGDHCSNIELASDGTKFKSFMSPNESLKFFRKSMCRPMNLYRTGEAETHGSLKGYRYVFEENALDNGVHNEQNKCYCRNGLCQPNGLIDVTDCYYGFPISLSYPHFLSGDPGLQSNVTGLTPRERNHSSFFVVQPESGLPLSLSVKIQINMRLNDLNSIRKVSQFSRLTIPMLWFEIMMPALPSALDTRFNFYLNILPYVDVLGFWVGLLLGLALLVYAVTRATLRMSNFPHNSAMADGLLYSKANLLCSSAIYQPCEMKLMTANEKRQQHTYVPRQASNNGEEMTEMLYTEIDLKPERRESTFALEMEPTIISDSTYEGNESDTGTMSRDSTISTNCICQQETDGDSDRASASSQHVRDENETYVGFGSGSSLSSTTNRDRDMATTRTSESTGNHKNNNKSKRRWSTCDTVEATSVGGARDAVRLTATPKSTQYLHSLN